MAIHTLLWCHGRKPKIHTEQLRSSCDNRALFHCLYCSSLKLELRNSALFFCTMCKMHFSFLMYHFKQIVLLTCEREGALGF